MPFQLDTKDPAIDWNRPIQYLIKGICGEEDRWVDCFASKGRGGIYVPDTNSLSGYKLAGESYKLIIRYAPETHIDELQKLYTEALAQLEAEHQERLLVRSNKLEGMRIFKLAGH